MSFIQFNKFIQNHTQVSFPMLKHYTEVSYLGTVRYSSKTITPVSTECSCVQF